MSNLIERGLIITGVAAAALIIYILVTPGTNEPLSKTMFGLNTVNEISIYDINLKSREKQELLEGCFALLEDYENKLSLKNAGSEISKINSAKGDETIVSDETLELIKTAFKYSYLTDGAFDITVKPLVELWGIGTVNPTSDSWTSATVAHKIPSDEKISEALNLAGYENITFTENGVLLLKGAQLDLGGIAKGFIADEIAAYLKEKGCQSAVINLGGNVVTVGSKPDGSNWGVGLRKPFGAQSEVLGVLLVSDKSVVTSGNYERYFEWEGKIYHHIIDLATGKPSEGDLDSVTVISESSADCDALSTACFVMGSERALEFLEAVPETEGLIVLKDGRILKTSGVGREVNFTQY